MLQELKKILPPTRKFVAWRFDGQEARLDRLDEKYEEQNVFLKQAVNAGQQAIDTGRQAIADLEKEFLDILKIQQSEISVQLEEMKAILSSQIQQIEKQNKIILDQQNQIKKLESQYRRELAGRIFEQLPNYMKGIHYPQRKVRIIVSLTSYLARIQFAAPCIYSILHQTVKPDMVLLWLSEADFPRKEKELPKELLDMQELGLEIRWCREDLKPHKKYYYAMKQYPEDIVITVDDDVIYRPHLIEDLYKAYQKKPDSVYTTRARKIGMDQDGNLLPYNDWKLYEEGPAEGPDYRLAATGVGGVLYPPHCLDEEVFNQDEIKELCLFTDDIWLKLMQLKKNIPVTKISWPYSLTYVEGSQENALYLCNMGQNQNDVCIWKMRSYFGGREGFLESMAALLADMGGFANGTDE